MADASALGDAGGPVPPPGAPPRLDVEPPSAEDEETFADFEDQFELPEDE